MEREGRESRFTRWLRRFERGSTRRGARDADAARARTELLLRAAAAGFPLAPAAHPSGYGCSCVRIGCPTPGRHPVSFAWQTLATTDRARVEQWARSEPGANFVTATGRGHDVLDVPAAAGWAALGQLDSAEVPLGPVALSGGERMLFFTATRGTPDDEDEWWPCELDCHPETMDEHPGLRWHCRGSYVLVPPARLPGEGLRSEVRWVRAPRAPEQTVPEAAAAPEAPEPPEHSRLAVLPEPLTLLEALTDACAEHAVDADDEAAPWPVR